MPTRTLYGWTPGSPIDGQRMRLYRYPEPKSLVGTYDMNNSATSVQVDVLANTAYLAELRSFCETDESTAIAKMFYVGSGFMGRASWATRLWDWIRLWLYGPPPVAFMEYVPPPTGTISVSDP